MSRDDSQGVGALRLAPVCPSVCPSVCHTLRYRLCVTNSSHTFQTLENFCSHNEDVHVELDGDKIIFDKIMPWST